LFQKDFFPFAVSFAEVLPQLIGGTFLAEVMCDVMEETTSKKELDTAETG
jgi:hypothetical protein